MRRINLHRLLAASLCLLLAVSGTGCGKERGREPESAWREEVDASLQSLLSSGSLSFRLHLETWIHTPGHSIYGEERGEGYLREGDFHVEVVRSSPQGEEAFTLFSREGAVFMREGDQERPLEVTEMPNPLYDPVRLVELVRDYSSVSLEEEGEADGVPRRLYLLQYDKKSAQMAFSQEAWSYFSNLDYSLSCRLSVTGASEPPGELQLELTGLDPQESLKRLAFKLTFQPLGT